MSALASGQLYPIDINLLQERKAAVKSGSLLPIALIVICAAGLGVMGWLWYDANTAIRQAESHIQSTDAQIAQLQAQLSSVQALGNAEQFMQIPQYLQHLQPKATDVLKQLAALLPMQSNVASLSLMDNDTIELTAVFASTESVISFSQAVQTSADFELISMNGFTKVKTDQKEEADQQAMADSGQPAILPAIQMTFELKVKDRKAKDQQAALGGQP